MAEAIAERADPGLPLPQDVTISAHGATARIVVARGWITYTANVDGTLRVDLDIRVYGRQVRGPVWFGKNGAIKNEAEAVDIVTHGRLTGRQVETCGRYAKAYARQGRQALYRELRRQREVLKDLDLLFEEAFSKDS